MDLFAPQTQGWIDTITAGADRSTSIAEVWSAAKTRDLLAADPSLRPPGHAADSRGFAARYLGNQKAIIRKALAERYPLDVAVMQVSPLPYLRMWARKDSGAYQQEAARALVNRTTKEPLPSASPMALAFIELASASRISEYAPEAERRAKTGLKSTTVHVGYLPPIGDDDGRPLLTHYWPHDVVIITHPAYPGEEEAIIFAALRQKHADAASAAEWIVFKRDFLDDPETGGVASWGAWQVGRFVDRDDYVVAWSEYDGTVLPIATLRLEPGDGSFWPAAESDNLSLSDGLNTTRANLDLVVDLQGHSNKVISSDTYDEVNQPAGPGAMIRVRAGESATYITPSPAIGEMREVIEEKSRAIGSVRGGDPNEYSAKQSGAVESGIARVVAKFPHELTMRESREAVRRFDERLMRICMDVHDAYAPVGAVLFGSDVRPRTDLAPSVVFEDAEAKQRRAMLDLDAGAISPAEYAVAVGLQPNKDKAIGAGYSDDARLRMPPAPAASVAAAMMVEPEADDAPGL